MSNNQIHISRFDIAEYLNDENLIQLYLNEILSNGSPKEFAQALNDVARARALHNLNTSQPTIENLNTDKPLFDSVFQAIHALGLQLTISPRIH